MKSKKVMEAGAAIFALLSNSTMLTRLISNKIFPIIAPVDTTYPFVVFSRRNVMPQSTKDGRMYDELTFEVVAVDDNYFDVCNVATEVINALEGKTYSETGLEVFNIKFTGATEAFTADAFLQTLTFTLKADDNN